MTTTSVGVGRVFSESGVRTDPRVRRYSWQFYSLLISRLHFPFHVVATYAAEKMPNEYYQHPAFPIEKAFEGMRFARSIEDR